MTNDKRIGYLTTGIPLDEHYEAERKARRLAERAALELLVKRGLRDQEQLDRLDATICHHCRDLPIEIGDSCVPCIEQRAAKAAAWAQDILNRTRGDTL